MTNPRKLGEAVQRYGYAKKKIKLYGEELELVSDPVNRQGDDVFVDAREKGTNRVKEVQVPRNVVEMAKGVRRRVSDCSCGITTVQPQCFENGIMRRTSQSSKATYSNVLAPE